MNFPDPKVVVDSIGDGALTVVNTLPDAGKRLLNVGADYAGQIESDISAIKSGLPDNPGVIVDTGVKLIGQTVSAGIGGVEALAASFLNTLNGVKTEIGRVIR